MISVRTTRLWLLLISLCFAPALAAGTDETRESKSDLMFNLALLSQVPSRPAQESYAVCAFEEDIGYLKAIALESQKLQSQQILLITAKTLADIKHCNLLYIQDYSPQKPLELQQIIQKESVLTVVFHGSRFSEYGHVVINEQDKHYQFALNLAAAKAAGIVFDTRLMKLATNLLN